MKKNHPSNKKVEFSCLILFTSFVLYIEREKTAIEPKIIRKAEKEAQRNERQRVATSL
jgi:hypothetical protein